MSSDLSVFLRQFIRRPHQVAALAPSSADLGRAMVEGIGPETGRVVEFGGGTGKLTKAILARGVAAADLTLFELNPVFANRLRDRFPGVTVHLAGAQTVAAHCAPGVGAVVSGLPLLTMSESLQRAIVGGAFDVLGPGGCFVQFTYGGRAPVDEVVCRALGIVATRGERIWGNLPPARVYRYHRRVQ